MRLPQLLVFTDRSLCTASLPVTISVAVAHGARAVVVRERDLPAAERREMLADLAAVLGAVNGTLIRSGPGLATPDGYATHLAARDPLVTPRPALVGRSCHNAAELHQAAVEGCDYVTLSPIFATDSKPGYGPALGSDGLAHLVPGAPPVFALGGVLPDRVAACQNAGAYGVAVMGPIMRDPAIVSAYLAAISEVPS